MPWLKRPRAASIARSDLEESFRISILGSLTTVTSYLVPTALLIRQWVRPATNVELGFYFFGTGLFILSALLVHRWNRYRWGALVYLFGWWMIAPASAILAGGLRVPGVLTIILFPLLGIATLGSRSGKVLVAISLCTMLTIAVLQRAGLVPPYELNADQEFRALGSVICAMILLSYWLGRTFERARRKAEQRIVESSRMADLGVLSAGISHEINNPLAAIRNAEYLIERGLSKSELNPESAKPVLDIIKASVKRVSRITESLTRYTHDETGEPCKVFPVALVVQDTISLCTERFESAGIRLELQGSEQDLMVCAHYAEIARILMSLINNSFDAVSAASDKWVRITTRRSGSFAEILVVDSGKEIPVELRAHLFTPFFTTKAPGKGMGLALAFGATALHQNGGRLYLEETAPHTTFVISLPKER